jgi:hypothetical protein
MIPLEKTELVAVVDDDELLRASLQASALPLSSWPRLVRKY